MTGLEARIPNTKSKEGLVRDAHKLKYLHPLGERTDK